jgi:hypothetical protein
MENGNKPAHPINKDHVDGRDYKGLTKREYFAGLAMQGILANASQDFSILERDVAHTSVCMADALLKSLETKTE